MSKNRLDSPARFHTGDGRTIYALSIETFPRFFNNVYLIDDGSRVLLIDTGSGFESSNRALLDGLASLEPAFGVRLSLADIDLVLITHAHSDHFGGIEFVRRHTEAPIAVHPLDLPVLAHYDERVLVAARRVDLFLQGAGVSDSRRRRLMEMYTAPKARFRSLPVDFLLEEGPAIAPGGEALDVEVLHVPGHCPGQVCLRLDDVLLSADHVLARITPHQAPESIILNTGLGHYLDSLRKVEALPGISLVLGGHEQPIEDLARRVEEIRSAHDERLDQVLQACHEPKTIAEVSRDLFDRLSGYNVLLALEETGAHVEYLHQRGALVAADLEQLESGTSPVLRYVRPS